MLVIVIVIGTRTVLMCVVVEGSVGVRVMMLVFARRFVIVPVIRIAMSVLVPVGHTVSMCVEVSVVVFRRHGRRFGSAANATRAARLRRLMLPARNPEIVALNARERAAVARPPPAEMAPADRHAVRIQEPSFALESSRAEKRDEPIVGKNVFRAAGHRGQNGPMCCAD